MVHGNRVTLLRNGEKYFPAIEAAFDRAEHEIYLETYIYENDASGKRIADALKRAAARGVAVHLMVDGFGSQNLPQEMTDNMEEAGVKVLRYGPKISPWTFQRQRLRRLHRKIAAIDGKIAYVGGINIINDIETAGPDSPRYDYAVAVEGPLAWIIFNSARRLWALVAWTNFHTGSIRVSPGPVSTPPAGNMRAAFLVRDNFRHHRDIEEAYMRAIKEAESEIIISNAYFLPGFNFLNALVKAAGRGVRVILLLQGRAEYFVVHYATRALYGNLLDAGIEIYEYNKSYLHAKVAVIDGHWATVGSSNIEPLSLLLSREANVVVDDMDFAATLKRSLYQAMESGVQRISKDKWKHQPAYKRFLGWVSYYIVRFIKGISGYDHETNRTGNEQAQ